MAFDREQQKGIVLLTNSVHPFDDVGSAYITGEISALLAKSKNELIVPVAELEKLVGNYTIMPNFTLAVTHDGKRLQVQATGQGKFPVYAKSNSHFYYKVVAAEIIFELDNNGEALSLTLHQAGQKFSGKRETPAN